MGACTVGRFNTLTTIYVDPNLYPSFILTSSLSSSTVCDPREASKGKSGTVQRKPPLAPVAAAAEASEGVEERGRLVMMTLRGLRTAMTYDGGDE